MDIFRKPTIREAVQAFKALEKINYPDNDNNDEAINSESVLLTLTDEQHDIVEEKADILREYVHPDGEPDRRSINALRRHGIHYSSGIIEIGDRHVNVSDPPPPE